MRVLLLRSGLPPELCSALADSTSERSEPPNPSRRAILRRTIAVSWTVWNPFEARPATKGSRRVTHHSKAPGRPVPTPPERLPRFGHHSRSRRAVGYRARRCSRCGRCRHVPVDRLYDNGLPFELVDLRQLASNTAARRLQRPERGGAAPRRPDGLPFLAVARRFRQETTRASCAAWRRSKAVGRCRRSLQRSKGASRRSAPGDEKHESPPKGSRSKTLAELWASPALAITGD